jgi:hypothetical protein
MVKGWEGVNGGVGARRPAAGSEDSRRSGEVQGFILYLIYLIKAGLPPVRFRPPIAERWTGGPREGREESYQAQPSFTTVGAAVDIGPEHPREEVLDGFGFGRRRSRFIEGVEADNQVLGAVAIGEEAIMPDPHEALGPVQSLPSSTTASIRSASTASSHDMLG